MSTLQVFPAQFKTIQDAAVYAAQCLGYQALKRKQREVIVKFDDVFDILPTGFGKSLCYACLLAVFNQLEKKKQSTPLSLL